jgi:hypothetical protein
MLILRAESQVASDFSSPGRSCARLEVDNRADWVLFLGNYLLRYGIKLLLGGFTYLEPSRDDLKERSASPTRIAVFRVAEQVENAGDRPAVGDKALSCDAKFY